MHRRKGRVRFRMETEEL